MQARKGAAGVQLGRNARVKLLAESTEFSYIAALDQHVHMVLRLGSVHALHNALSNIGNTENTCLGWSGEN